MLGLWMAYEAKTARDHLESGRSALGDVESAVRTANQSKATASLELAQEQIGAARGILHRPQWTVASWLPVVGDDVSALRTITSRVDDLTQEALPPLVDVAKTISLDSLKPGSGRFDFAPLSTASTQLATASAELKSANRVIGDIDTSSLLGPVRGPVRDAQSTVAEADAALRRLSLVADVLPPLTSGRHTYVAVFQNNAELRSTGGLPGAWAELTIDDGKVSIGRQGAGGSVQGDEPVAKMSKQTLQAFGPVFAQDFRDTNLTPDFPTAASLQTRLLKSVEGVDAEGVLSLDPVTLSYMLEALGPVSMPDGILLTSDDATDFLLNGVYVKYTDPADQDAFFALAARRIFERISQGKFDTAKLASTLVRAGEEGRIKVWTHDKDVEAKIAPTDIGGALPKGIDQPAIGYYLHDFTQAKMNYYLDVKQSVRAVRCRDDGSQVYEARLVFHSTAPADAATLPDYITGPSFKRPGSMALKIDAFGSAGAERPEFTVFGPTKSQAFTIGGRPMSRLSILLGPGERYPVTIRFTSAPGQHGDTLLGTTPTVRSKAMPGVIRSAC